MTKPNTSLVELAEPEVDRFWSRVDKRGPDECWPWRGSLTGNGYGALYIARRRNMAHRIAVQLSGRTIPEGLVVDHTCRTRHCVNPSHLRVVTSRINTIENSSSVPAINARKTHCIRGHRYTPEITYIKAKKNGTERVCRLCHRILTAEYEERQRQAAKLPHPPSTEICAEKACGRGKAGV